MCLVLLTCIYYNTKNNSCQVLMINKNVVHDALTSNYSKHFLTFKEQQCPATLYLSRP
jgi:hypothetical protein